MKTAFIEGEYWFNPVARQDCATKDEALDALMARATEIRAEVKQWVGMGKEISFDQIREAADLTGSVVGICRKPDERYTQRFYLRVMACGL